MLTPNLETALFDTISSGVSLCIDFYDENLSQILTGNTYTCYINTFVHLAPSRYYD